MPRALISRRSLLGFLTCVAAVLALKAQEALLSREEFRRRRISATSVDSKDTCGISENESKVRVETVAPTALNYSGTLILERYPGETDEDFVRRFPIEESEYASPDFLKMARESKRGDGLVFYPRVDDNIKVRIYKKSDPLQEATRVSY